MQNAVEKITKFKKAVNAAESVALFCHISPDGDTLGSGLALYCVLEKLGKTVKIFCDDAVPFRYQNMKAAEHIEKCNANGKDFDLAIAIDCSDIARLGFGSRCFLKIQNTIAVDHHFSHENFAKLEIVDPDASANAEIMFDIFEYCGWLDDDVAKLLFAALVSDNGCFEYSSTTAKSHEIARKLYGFDFDKNEVIYGVWKKKSVEVFNLTARIMTKCRFFNDNRIAVITFTAADFEATHTEQTATDGIVSNIIDIDTVEIAIAISEVNEFGYKVSIRTKESVDASECASVFGGGGHKRAAGCRLNGRYEDVLERLLKAASDRIV